VIRSRADRTCRFWVVLSTLAILGVLVAGCTLRAGGQDLVEAKCTRCHTLAPIEVQGRTRVEWDAVVQRMIEHGADLSAGQAQRVVDYLAETYRPGGE
jgi:hypothetical protein